MGELLLFEEQVFFLQELSSLVFLALEEEFFFFLNLIKANAHGTGRPADEDMQLKKFWGKVWLFHGDGVPAGGGDSSL